MRDKRMFAEQTLLAKAIWLLLVLFFLDALVVGNWPLAFVSLATLILSLAPVFAARWANIHVPPSFIAATVIFIGGTLFLGEVFGFYERFWWWDIAMHAGSAVGFGLIGFVLVFMMFQGDRYAAPPIAIAFFAFCFALAIGTMWEVFEFVMDQVFGLNMQKSGLMDTMGDLIVDMVGALVGAGSGWAYLRWQSKGGLGRLIEDFVARNPRFFRRFRK